MRKACGPARIGERGSRKRWRGRRGEGGGLQDRRRENPEVLPLGERGMCGDTSQVLFQIVSNVTHLADLPIFFLRTHRNAERPRS